jgi:hypothetical protein
MRRGSKKIHERRHRDLQNEGAEEVECCECRDLYRRPRALFDAIVPGGRSRPHCGVIIETGAENCAGLVVALRGVADLAVAARGRAEVAGNIRPPSPSEGKRSRIDFD